ncbi:MAG: hypothetical protein OXC59_10255 [Acidimicrobiaceae bacterium]|nr:hypothetical protein [Acidimicrobiaceae bacterium]
MVVEAMPRLYVYIVRHDIGFAPNPFYGFCTLATCKSGIRGHASVGDWIAGIGSKMKGQQGKLVFAMRVEETLCYEQYWCDSRFQQKKPNRVGSLKQRYGDNIYHRCLDGKSWIQEDSRHSLEDGSPNMAHVKRDTAASRVLLSETFVYYGCRAVEIPDEFRDWDGQDICECGRNYRYNFPEDLRKAFTTWLRGQAHLGIAGEPLDWSL